MAGTAERRTRQDLYLEISRDLTDDDVRNIRTYIGGEKVLPAGSIQHDTAHQMFNKLQRKGVLKQGELSFLVKLMKSIDRNDYADAAEAIAEQEREALGERTSTVQQNDNSPCALPTSVTGKQRSAKRKNSNEKPYSRPSVTQTAAEDLEDLITRNRVLLTKRLQVSDLFPLLIQKGLLQIHEKEDISSRTTGRGRAETLLDLLSQQGKCTCEEFKEVLTSGNHDHIVGQLK
ncbi:PREDICTED: uncharacterized protein LOC109462529 [Branchiostoma belcheri]|uniref:Uncharacterized protein LOC109462529 n=1 Tax=Branchiostoma belcheri TaxID=7741 RepID=A0A6P4XRD4_BRABE|nr:PREDICTED: uncharacterized protein LOC109462529 [Branchiostoma belcheri]